MRLEVSEGKQRERELTNQLQGLREQQTETSSQLTAANQKLDEEDVSWSVCWPISDQRFVDTCE